MDRGMIGCSNTRRAIRCMIFLSAALGLPAQVATTPPLTYNAITDRVPRPHPPLAQLGAAGSAFVDPTFGTRMMRVTDANIIPAFPSMSYVTMANGQNTEWNADSTKFLVSLLNGYSAIFQFDPLAFSATLMMDPNNPGEVFFPRGFQMFSFSDPNVYYAMTDTRHVSVAHNLSTGQTSTIVDWDTLIPTAGLPSVYFAGGVSADFTGTVFSTPIGGIQQTHPYIVVYNSTTAQSAVLDLKNSQVQMFGSTSFQPLSYQLGYGVHSSFLDRSGRYVSITLGNPISPTAIPNVPLTLIWDTQTGQISPWGPYPCGHDAVGFGGAVNQCGIQSGTDSNGWWMRQFNNLNNVTELALPEVSQPYRWTTDGHPSWNNARPGMNVPFAQEIFVTDSLNPYFPTRAWDGEIIAVPTDGSGTIWRFAHHHSILNGNFYDQPRANISQDGRYVLFTSNWENSFGTDSYGNHRLDVFLVELDQKYPAAPVADTVPPSKPIFLNVAPSATVSGIVDFTAAASDNVGVVAMNYRMGVNLQGPEITTAPFTFKLDTTKLTDGQHIIQAIARDAQYNVSVSDLLVFYVNNTVRATGISTFSVNPSVLQSGQSATGTVSLNGLAAPGGAAISLSSSNPATASVPSAVTVPQGINSVTFAVTSGSVAAATPVALTASYSGMTTTFGVTVVPAPPAAPSAKAAFVALDTSTQGNWETKYGADGYTIVDDSAKAPNYAAVTPPLTTDYIWSNSTTDVRALQKSSATSRIAAGWYSSSFFYVDLNFTNQSPHQVAVYCVDWDALGRAQTVDVLDAVTNAVLDTRSLASFSGGAYLVWNVTGHVKLRFTQTSSNFNAVVSGIFFGPGLSVGSSAAFVGFDTTTQGSWKSKYGADGYAVVDDSARNPSYASLTPSLNADYIWASSTTDGRALQRGSSTDRIAAAWYASPFFYVDLNITDQSPHQVAVYCLDWDVLGRAQTVDVLDGNTYRVLDSRVLSGMSGGVYLIWSISGHVRLRFTESSPNFNAVVSGIFFGAGPPAFTGPAAAFVTADITTQGNWNTKYGADGYTVVDDSARNPSYASLTPSLNTDYIWSGSTTDGRALQRASYAGRIAAAWYSPSFFYVDLNITDQSPHQVAVYCLDWDALGRAQTVDVLDASTNTVLDSRSLSGMSGGVYLIWNISGHVKLRVTQTSPNFNAVVSGIFFGAGPP